MGEKTITALFGSRHKAAETLAELRNSYVQAKAAIMSADYAGWSEAEFREQGGTEGGSGIIEPSDSTNSVRLAAIAGFGPIALSTSWLSDPSSTLLSKDHLSAELVRDGVADGMAEAMIEGVLSGGTVIRLAVRDAQANRAGAIMAGNDALLVN